MRKALKSILIFLLVFVSSLAVYLLAAALLSWIPSNNSFKETPGGTEIYILSNGVHTDIILPVKSDLKDWRAEIPIENTAGKDSSLHYVGFGWGDKGFYLNTPDWSDLKFSTAFKALFWLDHTAMHVNFYKKLSENKNCRKISITADEYHRLEQYIESSFEKDSSRHFIWIPNRGYGRNDAFYDASGTYSFLCTCNTWANTGLKKAGLKACLWTPFVQGIFYHYPLEAK